MLNKQISPICLSLLMTIGITACIFLEQTNLSLETLAWQPNGTVIAIGGRDGLVMYNSDTQDSYFLTENQSSSVRAVNWSPDGNYLVTSGEALRIWDISDREILGSVDRAVYSGPVSWSADSLSVAIGMTDGSIEIWDALNLQIVNTLERHEEHVTSVTWSPVARILASASFDGAIRIWQVDEGRLVSQFVNAAGPVYALSWSPDGTKLASVGRGNGVTIREADIRQIVADFDVNNADWITSTAWSPDGSKLAVTSSNDIMIFDTSYFEALNTLEGQGRIMNSLSWSSDSIRLASISADGKFYIWNTNTGETLEEVELR